MFVKSGYKIPANYTFEYNNVDEFLARIYPSNELVNAGNKRWIFRGQPANANLTPSALRGDALSRLTRWFYPNPSPEDQISLELRALRSFLEAADRQGIVVPGDTRAFRGDWINDQVDKRLGMVTAQGLWPDIDGIHVLTFAQQSGLPTRLLDWTKRSYVAAYFAATGTAKKAIYYQDESEVGDDMAVWAFSTEYLARYKEPKIEVVDVPTGLNQNLVLQRGCFTLVKPLLADNELKELCLEEAASINDKRSGGIFPLRKFVLDKGQRGKLLKRLSECEGIDGASMFTGIDGAMKYIRERAYWFVT